MENAAGVALASPMPTPTRALASWVKVFATPEAAVISDQNARPNEMRVRRCHTSASRPSGIPNTA